MCCQWYVCCHISCCCMYQKCGFALIWDILFTSNFLENEEGSLLLSNVGHKSFGVFIFKCFGKKHINVQKQQKLCLCLRSLWVFLLHRCWIYMRRMMSFRKRIASGICEKIYPNVESSTHLIHILASFDQEVLIRIH